MLNTSIALIFINTRVKNLKNIIKLPLLILFLSIDAVFLISNSIKFVSGGYVPVILGLTLAMIMFTWRWGRNQIRQSIAQKENISIGELLTYKNNETEHFPRSMIMFVADHPTKLTDKAPAIATLFKDRYAHLPRHMVLLTIRQKRGIAFVEGKDKYDIVEFDNDHENNRSLLSMQVNFGFMQDVDAEKIIKELAAMKALSADDDSSMWIIHAAKERVVVRTKAKGLQRFRYSLFRSLSRQAQPSYNYFGLDNDSRLSIELISIEL
jgi:KUP system potassium uptake protein